MMINTGSNENILDVIKPFKEIIIYGAGLYGKNLYKWCKRQVQFTDKNIYIAVTKLTSEKKLEGIWIESISEYHSLNKSSLVIVAVSEEKKDEIVSTLNEYGFCNIYGMSNRLFEFVLSDNQYHDSAQKSDNRYDDIMGAAKEILWGMNFDRLAKNTNWLKETDIKANWSAVGHYYLYILIMALSSNGFSDILDIGMGQTTKLISQFVNTRTDVRHLVIEGNARWIDFCKSQSWMSPNTEILQLNTQIRGGVRIYDGFEKVLKECKFDLLSIDGPEGYDMKEESRIDILDILPGCLKPSWIILIDDVERMGEQNTLKQTCRILEESNISYQCAVYKGLNSFAVLTSQDNAFYCTI